MEIRKQSREQSSSGHCRKLILRTSLLVAEAATIVAIAGTLLWGSTVRRVVTCTLAASTDRDQGCQPPSDGKVLFCTFSHKVSPKGILFVLECLMLQMKGMQDAFFLHQWHLILPEIHDFASKYMF